MSGITEYSFSSLSKLYNPIICNDSVFIGNDNNQIQAVNITTGEEVWNIMVGDKIKCISNENDNILYASSQDGNLYALNASTGELKWKFDAGTELSFPVEIIDETIFLCGEKNNCVYAIDSHTGKEQWKFQAEGWILCKPKVREGIVYFGSMDEYVYAVDAKTGQEIWRCELNNGIRTTPVFSEKYIYVGCGKSIYAVDLRTGVKKWSYETEEIQVMRNFIYSDGLLYYGGVKFIYAIDSISGQEIWKKDVWAKSDFGFLIDILDGFVYWHQKNKIYAFNSKTGVEDHNFKVGQSSYSYFPSFEPLSYKHLICIMSQKETHNDNARSEFELRAHKLHEFLEKYSYLKERYDFSRDISDYFIVDYDNGVIEMKLETDEILIPEDSDNFLSMFFASDIENSLGVSIGSPFEDEFYSDFFEIFKDDNNVVNSDLSGTLNGFDGYFDFTLEFLPNGIKWDAEYYGDDEEW
jgi:outer membrane protein assembly factor BamB